MTMPATADHELPGNVTPTVSVPVRSRPGVWRWVVVIGAVAAAGLIAILVHSRPVTRPAEEPIAAVTVPVVHPSWGELRASSSFAAEFQPYQQIDLYAQVAGFVKTIRVDIGDVVHRDQVLATLEIPELAQRVARARASVAQSAGEVERARAQDEEARQHLKRLSAVRSENQDLVAQQDVDDAQEHARATGAAVTAAIASEAAVQADLDRLQTEGTLCTIRAPFDGVITCRYADPGAIVRGGVSPSAPAMPLVRLSQNKRLRLRFPVPEHQAALVQVGQQVEVVVDCLGRHLEAKVARIARAVTEDTRTMQVEADMTNTDLSLIPGMFATASLTTQVLPHVLLVPVEAIRRSSAGTSVFVVGQDHRLRRQAVSVGAEMPGRVAITKGLSPDDAIVVGAAGRLDDGILVDAVPAITTPSHE